MFYDHTTLSVEETLKQYPPNALNNQLAPFTPQFRLAITKSEALAMANTAQTDDDQDPTIKRNLQQDAKYVETLLTNECPPFLYIWQNDSKKNHAVKQDIIFIRKEILDKNYSLEDNIKETHPEKIKIAFCHFFYRKPAAKAQALKIMQTVYICIYKLKFYAKLMLSESVVYGKNKSQATLLKTFHRHLFSTLNIQNNQLFQAIDQYLDWITGIHLKQQPTAIDYQQASLQIRMILRRFAGQYEPFLAEIKAQLALIADEQSLPLAQPERIGTVTAKITQTSYKEISPEKRLTEILSE